VSSTPNGLGITDSAIAFDLESFVADCDVVRVVGWWRGVRGRRFIRPSLTALGGDGGARTLAELEHKPWAADENEPWVAEFPWPHRLDRAEHLELAVAPDVAVILPPPQRSALGRSRPREQVKPSHPASTPLRLPAVSDRGRPSGPAKPERPERRAETERTLAQSARAIAERDAARAERNRAQVSVQSATRERDDALSRLQSAEHDRDDALSRLQSAEHDRDDALSRLQSAEHDRDDALSRLQSAEHDRDDALSRLQSAEHDRDDALFRLQSAEDTRDHALTLLQSTKGARDHALTRLQSAEHERDRALAGEAWAERQRDDAHLRGRQIGEELARIRAELTEVRSQLVQPRVVVPDRPDGYPPVLSRPSRHPATAQVLPRIFAVLALLLITGILLSIVAR
jgi:hypothetical protein